MADIPEPVRQFINKHIHSVDELEILLLLRDNPEKDWGAGAISKALQVERVVIETILKNLEAAGLVAVRDLQGERLYRSNQADPGTVKLIKELAQWYSTHRIRILTIIFSKPNEKIQTFADAFRIRKEEDH